MSTTLQYHVVDVFTSAPFAGNQLAIIHLPHLQALTQAQKQQIAVEFNYSESIFLTGIVPHYPVEIFTPQCEIPFAGHPTIGAACHIFEKLLEDTGHTTALLHAKAGSIDISYDRVRGVAQASIPHDFHLHTRSSFEQLAPRLAAVQSGIDISDVDADKANLVSIVKGMNFLLVELKDIETLTQVKITPTDPAISRDLDEGWPDTLIGSLFYTIPQKGSDGVWRARQRMIALGLEDPATGSASSGLACYLSLQMGGANTRYEFELEQGVEMGRRSVIGVEVVLDDTGKAIRDVVLKGQSKHVMKGELTI